MNPLTLIKIQGTVNVGICRVASVEEMDRRRFVSGPYFRLTVEGGRTQEQRWSGTMPANYEVQAGE